MTENLERALFCIFNMSTNELQQISVQELIVAMDFLSLPTLLRALENGVKLKRKVEEELLKNFEAPSIQEYTLINSSTKVTVKSDSELLWKLVAFSLAGLSGLRFSEEGECTIIFENRAKEGFVSLLFQQLSGIFNNPFEVV